MSTLQPDSTAPSLTDSAAARGELSNAFIALTPAQRRDLEIDFAQALDASSDRHRDYAKADALFQKCLRGDPFNPLIITTYLENLARWQTRRPNVSWKTWWNLRQLKRRKFQSVHQRYTATIAVASKSASVDLLFLLASICRESSQPLAESAFLREILERDSQSLKAHARLSELRLAEGDFASARRHWELANSKKSSPDAVSDLVAQCLTAIEECAPNRLSQPNASAPTTPLTEILKTAKAHLQQSRFSIAEMLLAHAQMAHGNSLAIRELREDVQVAQLRYQLAQLLPLETRGNGLASSARQSLYQKLTRLMLDIAGARADRYPDDWDQRLALVAELNQIGNHFEALRRLQDPPLPTTGPVRANRLRSLAETQQRLRRFEDALQSYRALLNSEDFSSLPDETQLRVRSQFERLEKAMRGS
jgi:tetratricopeptide (TPR) repeat protein